MTTTPGKTQLARSADRHNRVRRQHADELAQDYVEEIFSLSEQHAVVRVTDLQERFGVSHVTVIRTLRRLQDRDLVSRTQRRGIALTKAGVAMALEAGRRHALLVKFLTRLGVGEIQADADAEGIEHHLSDETITAISRFLGSGAE